MFSRSLSPTFQMLIQAVHRYCSCLFSTTARSCMPANMLLTASASRVPLKRKGFQLLPPDPHYLTCSHKCLTPNAGCTLNCTLLRLEPQERNWTWMNILIRTRRQGLTYTTFIFLVHSIPQLTPPSQSEDDDDFFDI